MTLWETYGELAKKCQQLDREADQGISAFCAITFLRRLAWVAESEIQSAVAAEREACAKIAEQMGENPELSAGKAFASRSIAAAIRARSA